jgi:hypothetical protein
MESQGRHPPGGAAFKPVDLLCNWPYSLFYVVIWPDRLAATKNKQLKGRCFIRETLTLAGQGFF